SVVMNSISRDLHASDNESIGINDGPASLGARAANYEDAVEAVVMNLVVGDASGSYREFAVAVVQLDTGAVIIVNEHGIDRTVIGVFNMNAVARAIGDCDMRDAQAVGRGAFEMNSDGPDSRALAVGNGICAADGDVFYGDI